jgi:hypothetical protein
VIDDAVLVRWAIPRSTTEANHRGLARNHVCSFSNRRVRTCLRSARLRLLADAAADSVALEGLTGLLTKCLPFAAVDWLSNEMLPVRFLPSSGSKEERARRSKSGVPSIMGS